MPYRTAIALTQTLRDRRISASELLEDTITRIGAYDERVTHPLLKARYADFAWEMSGRSAGISATQRMLELQSTPIFRPSHSWPTTTSRAETRFHRPWRAGQENTLVGCTMSI